MGYLKTRSGHSSAAATIDKSWGICHSTFYRINSSRASRPDSSLVAEWTVFKSAHSFFKSFQQTNFVQFLSMWTMQSWILVCGYIARNASGKPVSQSIQAIRISSTLPRFFNCVNTPIKNLEPSFSAIHSLKPLFSLQN